MKTDYVIFAYIYFMQMIKGIISSKTSWHFQDMSKNLFYTAFLRLVNKINALITSHFYLCYYEQVWFIVGGT